MKTMKIETIELSVPQRRLMEIFAKDLNEGDFGDKRIRLLLEYLRELLADEKMPSNTLCRMLDGTLLDLDFYKFYTAHMCNIYDCDYDSYAPTPDELSAEDYLDSLKNCFPQVFTGLLEKPRQFISASENLILTLHGVELLQLAERCLKILLDDGVADIEGLGAERRDDDRVDGPARDGRALLVGGDLVDLPGERGHEAVGAENEVLAQLVRDHLVVGTEMPRDPRAQIALRLLAEREDLRVLADGGSELFHRAVDLELYRVVDEQHAAVVGQVGENGGVLLARALRLFE